MALLMTKLSAPDGTARFYRASDLLDRLGIDRPEEIELTAIAQYCGATILEDNLSGAEARIVGFRDRAIITVNARSSPERRRFSAAHELGHWMHDRGVVSRGCTAREFISQWSRYNPEVRANRFAAELLMPTRLFRESARGRPITFATVTELASCYRTSITATAMRLLDCGSFPAMLICSRKNRREWFRRAPNVPQSLQPVTRLHAGSLARRLMEGRGMTVTPDEVQADRWIGSSGAGRSYVYEDSIRLGREYVLTLLSWRDEGQLLDLDADGKGF